MLITLVLLALSLAPNVVISTPLNIEPIDITRRQTAKQPADRLTPPDPPPQLQEFEYQCSRRGDDDVTLVWNELLVAIDIIKKGATIFGLSPFYQAMFAQSLRDNPSFELQAQTKYALAFTIFTSPAKTIKITCIQALCGVDTVAVVNPPLNILNLCDPWFDDSVRARSDVAATECKAGSDKADNWKNLAKFKRTKSFTLVHEIMHTRYPTQDVDNTADDYAYGVPHCRDLAAGTRDDVRCGPGNNELGRCDASKSFENADSLAFVPAGEYWTERCEKEIEVDSDGSVPDPVDYPDEDLIRETE